MILSFRWKIVLNMCALALLCSLASAVMSSWLLIKNHEAVIRQQLKSTAMTLITMGIRNYMELKDFEKLENLIDDALQIKKSEQVINVFSNTGTLLFSSLSTDETAFTQIFKQANKPTFSTHTINNRKFKILTTPYGTRHNKKYYLQIARYYPTYSDIIYSTLPEGILLMIILTLTAFVIALFLVKKIIVPVKLIAQHLNTLDPRHIREWQPMTLQRQGEYLNDITSGINELTMRIKSAFYNMSRTGRYLAHEIRNPLTILVGEAETVMNNSTATINDYQNVLKSSLEEVDRMNKVVDTILKIAKSEKSSFQPLPCNLVVLIEDNLGKWKTLLNGPISFSKSSDEIIGMLDPQLILRLLENLVINIQKHTPAPTCSIHLCKHEGRIQVIIEDDGPGMNSDLIEELNKGLLYSQSTGIGLMLCLEIAFICDFSLHFENKETGGLIVTLKV